MTNVITMSQMIPIGCYAMFGQIAKELKKNLKSKLQGK
jgi:hypothetical protein